MGKSAVAAMALATISRPISASPRPGAMAPAAEIIGAARAAPTAAA